jgi:ankyrin repeat protein
MTLRGGRPAVIAAMKTRHATLAAFALCFFVSPLRADEKPLREILRDGLYAEEVARDPAAAAKSYEDLLARYADERAFAASALFRLAEVRRKQDRKDDAIQLYQRLLTEFPQAENETKLARENLAAMGGKVPETETPAFDPESKELARLEALAKTSPDVVRAPETLFKAVQSGFPKVVAYLLSTGADPFGEDVLRAAMREGNLAIVKQLLATGAPIPEAAGQGAIRGAVEFGRGTVLKFLLENGARPGPRTFYDLVFGGKYAEAELLLNHGADPNAILLALNGSPSRLMLNDLIERGRFEAANWLLDHGAKPDIPDSPSGPTPPYYAANSTQPGCVEMMEQLLKAGADTKRLSIPSIPAWKAPNPGPPPSGETPLDAAIKSGYEVTGKVRILLAHGADPNITGQDYSPLQTAVGIGNYELAKMLIDAGADLKKPGLLTPFLDSRSESNVEKLNGTSWSSQV